MKTFLTLLIVLFTFNLSAETLVTNIHSYKQGDDFVRLKNGRVAFIDKSWVKKIEFTEGAKVRINIDENNNVKDLRIIQPNPNSEIELKVLHVEERPEYSPTILPDLESATKMFNRFSSNYKRVSECSDRAHIWSFEEFTANKISTQKAFIFFTASYINKTKFKWWFHVAPLVQVQEGEKIEARVMDFMYSDRPQLIKEWSDMMVYSKRPCKLTTLFSEYDENPQTEDCYMIIESMYYRLPNDIYDQELNKQYRTEFNGSEIDYARKISFEAITEETNQ